MFTENFFMVENKRFKNREISIFFKEFLKSKNYEVFSLIFDKKKSFEIFLVNKKFKIFINLKKSLGLIFY